MKKERGSGKCPEKNHVELWKEACHKLCALTHTHIPTTTIQTLGSFLLLLHQPKGSIARFPAKVMLLERARRSKTQEGEVTVPVTVLFPMPPSTLSTPVNPGLWGAGRFLVVLFPSAVRSSRPPSLPPPAARWLPRHPPSSAATKEPLPDAQALSYGETLADGRDQRGVLPAAGTAMATGTQLQDHFERLPVLTQCPRSRSFAPAHLALVTPALSL